MNQSIRIAIVDDQVDEQTQRIFGEEIVRRGSVEDENGISYDLVKFSCPDSFLKQMTLGEVRADAVLLDIDFSHLAVDRLRFVDSGSSQRQRWGIEILHTVKRIDPDFPVVMLTSLGERDLAFSSGKLGADGYVSKREVTFDETKFRKELSSHNHDELSADELEELAASRLATLSKLTLVVRNAIKSCGARTLYSHEHLATADEFANEYDAAEREKIATMAYYQYETDRIADLVRLALEGKPSGERLRVLDLGCGTGRIEEAFCQSEFGDRLDVVAVDFSGAMIRAAKAKLNAIETCVVHLGHRGDTTDGKLNVSLFRATAERLGFLNEHGSEPFDLVLLGFGFLSYVNYREVLKSKSGDEPTGGVFDLLRPGGKLMFSVYNEASAVYDRIAKTHTANDEMPVAAVMDPATGFLQVGLTRNFACDPFTVDRITRFVRQGGLTIDPEDVETFPTLHLMMNQSECIDFSVHSIFPPGRWDESLYDLDRRLSQVLPNRGHYIVGVAQRPN